MNDLGVTGPGTLHPGLSAERAELITGVFAACFGDLARVSPGAFRTKFRKMAASAIAFYRGSAGLFYADVAALADPFATGDASRVWIHGDLHAENFGSYMTPGGVLVFDVNDFDEAFVGPFTWDVRRLSASLALQAYAKAFSDEELRELVGTAVIAYVDQIGVFSATPGRASLTLTRDTTTGCVRDLLRRASLRTRAALLAGTTVVEDYQRRFVVADGVRRLSTAERAEVEAAFAEYTDTIPDGQGLSSRIKDVVAREGVGIGSAGLPSYNLLLEGHTEALENDVLLYMKQAQVATPSRFVDAPAVRAYFRHDGHRTALSQRALQESADRWLGHCTLRGVGQVVAEVSPYAVDLGWDAVDGFDGAREVARHLGRAAAKLHCVADAESDQVLVTACADQAIAAALDGRAQPFVEDMVAFAESYACQVLDDHRLFVTLFRNHRLLGL